MRILPIYERSEQLMFTERLYDEDLGTTSTRVS